MIINKWAYNITEEDQVSWWYEWKVKGRLVLLTEINPRSFLGLLHPVTMSEMNIDNKVD